MNKAKQEFINAIMNVLRLDNNIYTIGAIEKLIDRLKVSDYQLFIAFLGERKADYEKPIESIAKGVNEYYALKLEPHKVKSQEMQNKIAEAISLFEYSIKRQVTDKITDNELMEEIEKEYGNQSLEVKESHLSHYRSEKVNIILIEKLEEFYNNESREHYIFKEAQCTRSGAREMLFSKEMTDTIFGMGLSNFFKGRLVVNHNGTYLAPMGNIVFDYLFTKNVKPDIEEQIALKELNIIHKDDEVVAIEMKKLLVEKNNKKWSY